MNPSIINRGKGTGLVLDLNLSRAPKTTTTDPIVVAPMFFHERNVYHGENDGGYDMVLIDLESLTRSTTIPTMKGEGGTFMLSSTKELPMPQRVPTSSSGGRSFLMGLSWAGNIAADAIDFYRIQQAVVANVDG